MKLCVITPTGKRPKMLPLCQRWVDHQTRQPDRWVVSLGVDEKLGDMVPRYGRDVVHFWGRSTVGQPMSGQIDTNSKYQIEALRQVPEGHHAVFFDDDDWYGPGYLDAIERDIERGIDISGNGSERRYSLLLHKWMHIEKSGCNAGAVAITSPAIPDFIEWLQHPETKWDWLEQRWTVNLRNRAERVSIKHGPGLGHLFPPDEKKWRSEVGRWSKLKEWIGEDVKHYKELTCKST